MRGFGWRGLYREAELYKAAVRLYTKPLFNWRKALTASTDGRTFYDFARRGLPSLEALHQALAREEFRFRPGLVLDYNFNGKRRRLHIYPWEERLVDLLLYRLLTRRLQDWFSPHSYAYRHGAYGIDRCQRRIARALSAGRPLYVLKRDISDYFASIDHEIMLGQLSELIEPGDYLFRLLASRVRFEVARDGAVVTASRGVPFGTAAACVLANIHLSDLDQRLSALPGLRYFRYADDFLMVSEKRETAFDAAALFDERMRALKLAVKPSHRKDVVFTVAPILDPRFQAERRLRHLGLEFRAGGPTGLSRDKFRKLRNLFRSSFRRYKAKFKKLGSPEARARLAVDLAKKTIAQGVRNVAIIDYYLRHVEDEKQLRLLDRWLAEETLSLAFGGHKKGHFKELGFRRLRQWGLPSLVHRRRLIEHGHVRSPFFIWKERQISRASQGAAARPAVASRAFSPCPEAMVVNSL